MKKKGSKKYALAAQSLCRVSGAGIFHIGRLCALASLSCLGLLSVCIAQDPSAINTKSTMPPGPAASSATSTESSSAGGSPTFLGKDVPFFDPGTETITWDGRSWNISNNRIFQARFEKFLNAAGENNEEDKKYQDIIKTIIDKLAPGSVTPKAVDEAFALLATASEYSADANLCDSLASQIYSAWLARRSQDRLLAANKALEDERKRIEWNSKLTAQGSSLNAITGTAENRAEMQKREQLKRDMEMTPLITRLAEVNTLIKANQLKKEVAELQVKIEFQAILVQLFFQRRFQHVVIGTRFYRNIFPDGETQLKLDGEAKDIFSKATGLPPTLTTLDSMAGEAMRDIREGIEAFNFLLEQDEMEGATKRLSETFIIGEYMADVRLLPREKKRKALTFVSQTNQLINAIEVKDYTLAEELVKKLSESAKDFDSAKPMAAIETARTIAGMHLAKARNAAVSNDKITLETELKAATEAWPRNPALAEVSKLIFDQGDVQSRALVDFDQLIAQKNYRQIYDDRMRFIAATASSPERQLQLKEVLDEIMNIEGACVRAQEVAKRGDFAGAWESAERSFRDHPNDNKLNQMRADYTTQAPEFVRTLRNAEDLEKKDQLGSALAGFLNAQDIYPPSEFAREGIQRVKKILFPDAD